MWFIQSTDNAWCTEESEHPGNHFKGPKQGIEAHRLRSIAPACYFKGFALSPLSLTGPWKESPSAPEKARRSDLAGREKAHSDPWAPAGSSQQRFRKLSRSSPHLQLETEPSLSQYNNSIFCEGLMSSQRIPCLEWSLMGSKTTRHKKHCQAGCPCPIPSRGGTHCP